MASNPILWGPDGWNYLHTLAFTYPNKPTAEYRERTEKFLRAFIEALPCDECSRHASYFFEQNPPKLNSKWQFVKWTLDFHNSVSARKGRRVWTLEELKEAQAAKFADRAERAASAVEQDTPEDRMRRGGIVAAGILALTAVIAVFRK